MPNTKPIGVAYSDPALDSVSVSDEASIGDDAASLVGFHGAAPVAQAAFVTAVGVTGAGTALVGFASTAQAQAMADAINSIRTILINKGFMAAS